MDADLVGLLLWLHKKSYNSNDPLPTSEDGWYELYVLALRHRVDALLYKLLCSRTELLNTVPSPIRRAFRFTYLFNREQNWRGLLEANRLAYACDILGIRICVERGMALLNDIYPDIGVRPMQDIDFLARPEDCVLLDTLLISSGYKISRVNDCKTENLPDISEISSVLYEKQRTHEDWEKEITVDVAFRIDHCDTDQMLRNSSISSAVRWRILQPEDLFLLLCRGLYDDALERTQAPAPTDCTLGKLIDAVLYCQCHPIDLPKLLREDPVTAYAETCARSIFGVSLF
jgi:hypothetical protein